MAKTTFLTCKIILLIVILFLGIACSSSPEIQVENEPDKLDKNHFSRFSSEPENKETKTEALPTGSLLVKATEFEKKGNYTKSASFIERSLRIDPENAYLWYRLANANFKMGHYEQAIQFAQRSNSFSNTDKSQLKVNENLIKHAKIYLLDD